MRLYLNLILIIFLSACGSSASTNTTEATATEDKSWRYFDRELYLATGSSVSPEVGVAQLLIEEALKEIEKNTDLGIDYFIIKYEEESLLQPVANQTSGVGRSWKSFINLYSDEVFNSFLTEAIGESLDTDIITAVNKNNSKEYFIMTRLDCFTSSENCNKPNQTQSKAFIYRSIGYLLGLRYGDNSYSAIMRPGVSKDQESEDEFKKYCNEINNKLENIRNENKK